ncbi:sigma-70 region 4 domain-containing protein [Streptomyces showdoensis]|nr:sigma-70 region 4 domain-containing protein [Streptomyces showdoensis]
MGELSAEARGDMAQAMLPEAAGLIVDVHEGSAQDIRSRLQGLTRHELEALAVVVAALADPERPVLDALRWVDFDEYGDHVPVSTSRSARRVRDAVPNAAPRGHGIDVVAVDRALTPGDSVWLSSPERAFAVDVGIRRGMPYEDVAERLGMTVAAVQKAWTRAKERALAEGRPVPRQPVGQIGNVA